MCSFSIIVWLYGTHDTHEELSPTGGHGFDDLNYFSEDTADWSGSEQELGLNDWSMEFRSLQPQDMLSRFIDICLNTSSKHVPVKRRYAGLRFNGRIPRNRGKQTYEEEETYRCATAESGL